VDYPPIVKKLAQAFANNHLEHVGGADSDTLVKGTPNWHFFTRDAESAIRVIEEMFGEEKFRSEAPH
jgi:hypothetical protein